MPVINKLFLSAARSEFFVYVEMLTEALKRRAIDIAIQDYFMFTEGGQPLLELSDYIRACDGVVHLIGKATGDSPDKLEIAALLYRYPDFASRLPPLAPALSEPQPGFSYTQWEAYLAIYHDRPLFVYYPTDLAHEFPSVSRDPRFVLSTIEVQAQKEHHQRILELGHYRKRRPFVSEKHLSGAVLGDLLEMQREAISVSVPDLPEPPSALEDKLSAVSPLPAVSTEGTHPVLFLCYRREDTSDAAGRLHDRLVGDFGPDGVFMDIDSVPLGTDFVDHVAEQISKCRAVIVMIGKQWIKVKDKRRRRRLDNEDDLVRVEIAAALRQRVPVIPVLVQDAAMPPADELPENIRLLARRNGISLSASRWHADVERLMKELDPVMKR